MALASSSKLQAVNKSDLFPPQRLEEQAEDVANATSASNKVSIVDQNSTKDTSSIIPLIQLQPTSNAKKQSIEEQEPSVKAQKQSAEESTICQNADVPNQQVDWDSYELKQGCYLIYNPEGSGSLLMQWSTEGIANSNILCYIKPRDNAPIPKFKLQKNQGTSIFMKNLKDMNSPAEIKKRDEVYLDTWCRFLKISCDISGTFIFFWEKGNDFAPGVQLFSLSDNASNSGIVQKLQGSTYYKADNFSKVSVIPCSSAAITSRECTAALFLKQTQERNGKMATFVGHA
ncbi:hypothetical protein IE077_001080 [Cardiosporidium cionae]|uniref:Immune mapped protein 2 N-terminal domain-containing protein n=1 Tax=Cardiosporidium cionae TaxID=476202 RepID=A0ABQ7J634_9APIC|nr:hypothetical protein IE077_001080 [Cardiosporidium cionae]|eukprot:KAF8819389.1 hypothetical protein IE077_001080 [Cardiosporidium cionae]